MLDVPAAPGVHMQETPEPRRAGSECHTKEKEKKRKEVDRDRWERSHTGQRTENSFGRLPPSSPSRNLSVPCASGSESSLRIGLLTLPPLPVRAAAAPFVPVFMLSASWLSRSHFACRADLTASALFCCSVYSCEHSSKRPGFTSMNSFIALYTMPWMVLLQR